MSRAILFLCVLAILSSAHLSSANEWNALQPQKCSELVTRKEWRTLTHSEKAEWVEAVKCLASIRHERLSLTENQTMLEGKRSLYDGFSYSHASVENSAHRNAYFLPWRAFSCSLSPSPSTYLRERRPLVHLPIRHLPPQHVRVQRANTILGLVARSCRPVPLARVRGIARVRARRNRGLRILPRGGLHRPHRRLFSIQW